MLYIILLIQNINTPDVGLEPTTTRLKVLALAD